MGSRIAFLGIGNMGQAMCKNLVERGDFERPLFLYNRTNSRAKEVSARIGHSVVVDTVEEAVLQADIIFTCMTDAAAVKETFAKILTQNVEGRLFVECSTTPREHTNELAKKIEALGAHFVAMPVFGEPTMAEKGLLTCVPAGKAEQVKRVRPYCVGVLGRSIVDLSDHEPGEASLLKLIGNVFIVNIIETLAEAHVLAEKNGLKVRHLQNAIDTLFGGPYTIYSERMTSGDYYKNKPMVPINDCHRLASEILDLGKRSGTSLKAYEQGVKHMEVVQQYSGASGDISGIYGAVRLESGLGFVNQDEALNQTAPA